jgi:hypothetical protein
MSLSHSIEGIAKVTLSCRRGLHGRQACTLEPAILADAAAFAGQRTATILTGGNITVQDLSRSIHP